MVLDLLGRKILNPDRYSEAQVLPSDTEGLGGPSSSVKNQT